MNTIEQISSRELQLVLLRRKIAREDACLAAAATDLEIRRDKQYRRLRELGVQETLLKFQRAAGILPEDQINQPKTL